MIQYDEKTEIKKMLKFIFILLILASGLIYLLFGLINTMIQDKDIKQKPKTELNTKYDDTKK